MINTEEQIASKFAERLLAEMSIVDRIQAASSWWDLLWFGLAIYTAFKLGVGATSGDD